MKFSEPFIEEILIKRYKRFLADIELADGNIITAHTPNTGAMTGCSTPGVRVWLRDTRNPDRKYPYSWEIVEAFTYSATVLTTEIRLVQSLPVLINQC